MRPGPGAPGARRVHEVPSHRRRIAGADRSGPGRGARTRLTRRRSPSPRPTRHHGAVSHSDRSDEMPPLAHDDIKAATDRIAGRVRPVAVVPTGPGETAEGRVPPGRQVFLALEFMQHTGSFKARGAQNFLQAHRDAGTLPDVGVTIASGGNAGLACAWAARQQGCRPPCSSRPTPPPSRWPGSARTGPRCVLSAPSTPRRRPPAPSSPPPPARSPRTPTTTR